MRSLPQSRSTIDRGGIVETGEAEYEKVIEITDRLIASGNPQQVAFWLGYRHGIKHQRVGIDSVLPTEEYRRFIEIAEQGHSDKFTEAYAHGYVHGIVGRSFREILDEKGKISGQYLPPSRGEA